MKSLNYYFENRRYGDQRSGIFLLEETGYGIALIYLLLNLTIFM